MSDQPNNSQDDYKAILDSTAEAIYGLDLDGICTFCNVASYVMLGYDSKSDLLGKNIHKLIHHTRPDGAPDPMQDCPMHRAFVKDEKYHLDSEVLFRKDGSSFPVECWSHPIVRDGNSTGCLVTFLDISERKQAEQELKKSHVR